MTAVHMGLRRWVSEFDAAQKLTGDDRRKAEAMAASRLRGWVMREFPEDEGGKRGVSTASIDGKSGPPFVASEYVGLPGDRILFVAHDPHTGICCAGRESSDEAQYDAQGMRAAWRLGYATAMKAAMLKLGYSPEMPVAREPTYAEWMREERRLAIEAIGFV